MTLALDKSNWKRVAFGDAIDNISDRVDDPSAAGVDRYVGLEHLDPGVLTVQRWDSPDKVEAQKLRFLPGDVIFGRRRAYQKKVAKAEFAGICSAHALVLRAKPDSVDPQFLPIFLSSDYFLDRAIAISVGSLSPTVNWRDLKVEQFDLPPLSEQQRIADLIWLLEAHRVAAMGLRCALQVAQTEFIEQAASLVQHTYLSQWISNIEAGRSPQGASEPAMNGELGVLKVSAVGDGIFAAHENKRLLDKNDFRADMSVREGDLLVTRANALVENVARPCIVSRDYPNLMLSDKTLRLIPNAKYPSRIVLAALRTRKYRDHVRESVGGTEAKNISQRKILAGPVPDWDEASLAKVACFLDASDRTTASCDAEIGSLSAARSAIMSCVFGDRS